MKKILLVAITLCFSTIMFAYNPPLSGESLDRLVSPTQLTYGSSSAGGAIFSAGPDAIIFNPALIASEQRISLDGSYTALFSANGGAKIFGSAFQAGFLFPWRWFVASGVIKGTFLPIDKFDVGNTVTTNVAMAKEVSERLTVGLGMYGGVFFGHSSDWSLGANIGMLYRIAELGFMKDFRIGASVLNLGKNFSDTTLKGIDGENKAGIFPMIGTAHLGVATSLFANDYVNLGLSLELIAPGFQNLIVATGFHFSVNNSLYIRVAEEINIREAIALKDKPGFSNFMPSISLGYKFTLNAKNNNYLSRNGWEQSEITINTGWQQLYESIHAVSANVKFNLGMQDTDPPVIELWNGEN